MSMSIHFWFAGCASVTSDPMLAKEAAAGFELVGVRAVQSILCFIRYIYAFEVVLICRD